MVTSSNSNNLANAVFSVRVARIKLRIAARGNVAIPGKDCDLIGGLVETMLPQIVSPFVLIAITLSSLVSAQARAPRRRYPELNTVSLPVVGHGCVKDWVKVIRKTAREPRSHARQSNHVSLVVTTMVHSAVHGLQLTDNQQTISIMTTRHPSRTMLRMEGQMNKLSWIL